MKQLLILRHGKAQRDAAPGIDFDRALAPRGEAEARQMGRALAALAMIPDAILTSTAIRAHDTAREAAAVMAFAGKIAEERALYAASAETLQMAVCATGGDPARVLLVGHNPGLEELVTLLTGATVQLPTSALVCIEFPGARWADLTPGCGTLRWLLTPHIVMQLTGTR